jgi:AcrR family transcriptional regulator
MNTRSTQETGPRGDASRPSKGAASRATILHTAAKLATMRGLDGLSIGDLAAEVGMSKSGLYAHFKSKEELELATIEAAAAIFESEVLHPTARAHAGAERLGALADAFLSHVERRVFPGGCFFAAVASELDTRPGPARDSVVAELDTWQSLLRQCLLDAQASGEIHPKAEIAQAVFEIQAMMLAGNFQFVMTNDPILLTRARKGVEHVLARVTVGEEPKRKRSARGSP